MTDPAYRHGLKKPGFFVLTGYPYAANYGGPPPDHDTIMWGAPVPTAWRIGKTYLKYELIRTQLKLECAPGEVRLGTGAGVEIEEVERFPEEGLAGLFARSAEPHGAIAVRDTAHLNWRFADHPERDYAIALARKNGRLVGFSVYRHGDFDGREGAALVCDWIVPPVETRAGHALRAWLVERARADGAEHLSAVFPESCADWLAFQMAGFRAAPTRYFLVGRNYVKKYDMRWLYRHWYYTLGDTDLV